MPPIELLESLVDTNNTNPALPTDHPFDNVQSVGYWSATTNAANPTSAFLVFFGSGGVTISFKDGGFGAWCVR